MRIYRRRRPRFSGFANVRVMPLDFLINASGGRRVRERKSYARLHTSAIVLPEVVCAANFAFGPLVRPGRFRGDTTIKGNDGIGIDNVDGGFVRSVRSGFSRLVFIVEHSIKSTADTPSPLGIKHPHSFPLIQRRNIPERV